jgi:hypothetical protein
MAPPCGPIPRLEVASFPMTRRTFSSRPTSLTCRFAVVPKPGELGESYTGIDEHRRIAESRRSQLWARSRGGSRSPASRSTADPGHEAASARRRSCSSPSSTSLEEHWQPCAVVAVAGFHRASSDSMKLRRVRGGCSTSRGMPRSRGTRRAGGLLRNRPGRCGARRSNLQVTGKVGEVDGMSYRSMLRTPWASSDPQSGDLSSPIIRCSGAALGSDCRMSVICFTGQTPERE